MNDRKRAWQLLHNEIRRRADAIDGNTWATLSGTIMRDVENVNDLVIELAGFGATFALMYRGPEVVSVADKIGAGVMLEPDERDDDEND